MPDAGPREGSSEWIKEMTNSLDLVTFGQLSRYSELLRAWVRLEHEKNSSEKHGYVRLRPGEVVPKGVVYDSSGVEAGSVLKETRRHMEYHLNLEFLRGGAVKYALERLRDAALYPRVMAPKTLPSNVKGYDNLAKVVNTFLVHYCFAQGLSRSAEMTRQVSTCLTAYPNKLHSRPHGLVVHIRTNLIHVRTDYLFTSEHTSLTSVRITSHILPRYKCTSVMDTGNWRKNPRRCIASFKWVYIGLLRRKRLNPTGACC